MICSLDRHLEVSVNPARPESLISDEQLANVHAIARLLPSALTEFFGFECRLGEPEPCADFLVCAKAATGGREVLAGVQPDGDFPQPLLTDPVWQRIRQFARGWSDPASALFSRVDNVWLEFDMDRAIARPAPSLFFGTQHLRGPSAAGATDAADVVASGTDHHWLYDAALVDLINERVMTRVRPAMRKALAALPPGAHVFQVGAMLARDVEMIRVCVRGLSATHASAYVRNIGWSGPSDDVDALVSDVFRRADSVDVDLDIGAEVGPKIGLECSFLPTASTHARQRAFLDYLVDANLCTAEKRHGLDQWARGFHERSNPDRWPDDLKRRSRELGEGFLSAFVRWLYHVKLVYQPGHALHAKAYLAVRQFWPSTETLRAMLTADRTE